MQRGEVMIFGVLTIVSMTKSMGMRTTEPDQLQQKGRIEPGQ